MVIEFCMFCMVVRVVDGAQEQFDKKINEDLNVFRNYFRVRQEVSDEIQTSIYFIKDELQTYIENNISCKKIKEKSFWLNGDGLKNFSLLILWKI